MIRKSIRLHRLSSLFKAFILAILALQILACATTAQTPIESRAQPPSKKILTHIVEKGDTLYSIAWRYEQNYKQLAAINGIRAPYTIYAGQKIRLAGSATSTSTASKDSSRSATSAPSASSGSSRSVPPVKPAATAPVASNPTQQASKAPKQSSTTSASTRTAGVPASVQGWNWPLNGKITKTFGSNDLTKGITIDSSANKEVKAAAEGVVVYSGSGVRGYGNFLILKHSDAYLSAYAYNSQLLAKEGDQVRQGQKIALAGKDKDGKPRLYFEIRKNGKPVDPVRYLPRR